MAVTGARAKVAGRMVAGSKGQGKQRLQGADERDRGAAAVPVAEPVSPTPNLTPGLGSEQQLQPGPLSPLVFKSKKRVFFPMMKREKIILSWI